DSFVDGLRRAQVHPLHRPTRAEHKAHIARRAAFPLLPLDLWVLLESGELNQIQHDHSVGECLEQPAMRALIELLLTGELGQGLAQLTFEPLLVSAESLELLEAVGAGWGPQ